MPTAIRRPDSARKNLPRSCSGEIDIVGASHARDPVPKSAELLRVRVYRHAAARDKWVVGEEIRHAFPYALLEVL